MNNTLSKIFKKYSHLCIENLKESKEYLESLDIIRQNTRNDVWLIGGMVYRGIAHKLYGVEKPKIDLDFIVSSYPKLKLPNSWTYSINNFGNPKLTNGKISIDFIPLTNIFSIRYQKLEPTIENYLAGVPLTIQSIAFDVNNEKVIGKVGIKAILNKTIAIHNQKQAELFSKRYNRSIEEYLKEKANSLGFTALI